jgi:hypothetical protein
MAALAIQFTVARFNISRMGKLYSFSLLTEADPSTESTSELPQLRVLEAHPA